MGVDVEEIMKEAKKKSEKIKELTNELEMLKSQLQTEGLEILENRNIKQHVFSSTVGNCVVGYKEKLTVDNLEALENLFGTLLDGKLKVVNEPKITITETRFKEALIALYKGDYKEHDISAILKELGLSDKESKTVQKKLKGDYYKDKKLLESFGASGDLEEELDQIREEWNRALVERFFGQEKFAVDILKRAIFVEDTLSIGFDFS